MLAFVTLMLAAQPMQAPAPISKTTTTLMELFRLTDEYRQCLILDKSQAERPRDSYFASGGMSAENLDLMLADRQDRLLKRLTATGKGNDVIDALRGVRLTQVDADRCRDFDPYFESALKPLEELEAEAGIATYRLQIRSRSQHQH